MEFSSSLELLLTLQMTKMFIISTLKLPQNVDNWGQLKKWLKAKEIAMTQSKLKIFYLSWN